MKTLKDIVKYNRKTMRKKEIPYMPIEAVFAMTPEEARKDPNIKKMPGRQNKRKGTLWRKKQRIVKASRRKNRSKNK